MSFESTPTKVLRQFNPNYKRDPNLAYAKPLLRYNITPTIPGPFAREKSATPNGYGSSLPKPNSSLIRVFHPTTSSQNPNTKTPATAQTGTVKATDIYGDSEYLFPIKIGTPPVLFNVDGDTGSSDLWVLGPACKTSQSPPRNYYNPTAKTDSTGKLLKGYTWSIQYGDGSYASGTVYQDTVNIGGVNITGQAVEMATSAAAVFSNYAGDSLLGLGFSNINTVSPAQQKTPVDNMVSKKLIAKGIFTGLLGSDIYNSGSFYTFGYVDAPTLKACKATDFLWTPVTNTNGYWQVGSTAISINGTTTQRAKNQAIIDTGTTLYLVDTATCTAIYAAIPNSFNDPNYGWCFPATSNVSASLPKIVVTVGSAQITIDPKFLSYAFIDDATCFGLFQDRGDFPFDIAGDGFLRNTYSCWDLPNLRYGCLQAPPQMSS